MEPLIDPKARQIVPRSTLKKGEPPKEISQKQAEF